MNPCRPWAEDDGISGRGVNFHDFSSTGEGEPYRAFDLNGGVFRDLAERRRPVTASL